MKKPKFKSVNSKKELLDLQRAFAEIIRRPLNANDGMSLDPRSEQLIHKGTKLTPHTRMQLYAQQYWWRIQSSFDEDFPTVHLVLGAKRFITIRDAYLKKFPSISFTLRHLGYRLPKYLKKCPLLSTSMRRKAIDAATLDLARIVAFDAASHPSLQLTDVQHPRFPLRTIRLQPYIQLLKMDFDFTQRVQGTSDARSEVSSNTQKRMTKIEGSTRSTIKARKHFLAIHRFQGKIFTKECSFNEFSILIKLQQGTSLTSLLRPGKKTISQDEVFKAFQEWISLGWIW